MQVYAALSPQRCSPAAAQQPHAVAPGGPAASCTIPACWPAEEELPPRRLQWAAAAAQPDGQAEEEWCTYGLGGASPSPCARAPQQPGRTACPAGGRSTCNPLFSFDPQPGARLGWEAPCAGAVPPHQSHDVAAAEAAAHPHARPAVAASSAAHEGMPPICGQFASVAALLEALTPPGDAPSATAGAAVQHHRSSAGAAHAAAARQRQEAPPAPREQSPQRTPHAVRPDSAATDSSMERKLQAAVASFFETVQKAPPARGAASAERVAALSSLAKRQQRKRQLRSSPLAAPVAGPALRNGRPNRAADQRQMGPCAACNA